MFNDAAKEGTDQPGLGGWICGYTWVVPLTPADLELDVPVLEGIAAVVNVVAARRITLITCLKMCASNHTLTLKLLHIS